MRPALMWTDALACFVVPRLARWTAVVVDRMDGEEYPVRSVRLRRRSSIDEWVRMATAEWVERGMTIQFEARKLERADG